jgi:SAM-dependent methyltransferase
LCRNCKNVYSSPRPKYNQDFLNAAYADYYLFNDSYEYEQSKKVNFIHNNFQKEIEEIITFDKQKKNILDVGCAMGDFLYYAKKHYLQVTGVEISQKMAEFASKKLDIKVYQEQFDNLKMDERFSCIHLSHIIEHVPNPNDWLNKAKELLSPGGILVICVPNMFSFSRIGKLLLKQIGLRKSAWGNPSRTPDHLFEPTVPSLRYFLEMGGFEIVSLYSYRRRNMTSKGIGGWLFHRILKNGSNLRVFAKVK